MGSEDDLLHILMLLGTFVGHENIQSRTLYKAGSSILVNWVQTCSNISSLCSSLREISTRILVGIDSINTRTRIFATG